MAVSEEFAGFRQEGKPNESERLRIAEQPRLRASIHYTTGRVYTPCNGSLLCLQSTERIPEYRDTGISAAAASRIPGKPFGISDVSKRRAAKQHVRVSVTCHRRVSSCCTRVSDTSNKRISRSRLFQSAFFGRKLYRRTGIRFARWRKCNTRLWDAVLSQRFRRKQLPSRYR